MAKNDFLPFATADGANVLSADEYQKLTSRSNGFSAGVARSQELNTVWRQASVIAHVVAQFIADTNNSDVADNGDLDALKTGLVSALSKNVSNTVSAASTTVAGITKLSSATNSNDETMAATPKAIKSINDKIAFINVKTVNAKSPDANGNIQITSADTGSLPSGGTAAAASKLATARTIGGVSFDGTANINLPGVNAAGNQSTTGNAATATKLATARTINGVAFDGTKNITLTPKNLGLVGIVETGSGTGYYWRKYSDGKIEIFARFSLTIGAPLNVVFPKVFTEMPLILVKENGGPEVNGWVMRARNLSKTGFSVQWNLWSGSGQGSAIDVCYHAIGS